MRKPETTKKMSTPRYPPGSQPGLRWKTGTATMASARRPSRPGRQLSRRLARRGAGRVDGSARQGRIGDCGHGASFARGPWTSAVTVKWRTDRPW